MSLFEPSTLLRRCVTTLLLACAVGLVPALAASTAMAAGRSDVEWIDPWKVKKAGLRERQDSHSAKPALGQDGAMPLLRAIELYRNIEKAGGWQRIPSGEPLSEGLRDRRVGLIRQRLMATGELKARGADPDRFDAELTEAIRRFQERNGLPPDGNAGRRVLDAMNVPVRQRLRQLEASLSRINTMSGKLGQRYVFVNLTGQEVEAVENGRVVLRKRVIVGKEDRQTPEYTSRINSVTLNPYWNVPYSIASKDMIGKIRGNPGYLDRMGIRVFRNADRAEVSAQSVDWSSPGALNRYRLRQDPSRYNSLGTVRVNFPNPHAVYLHDTPVKTLFGREERSFSSGCVRVEDIRDLAVWLLKPSGVWSAPQVDAAIARGGNLDVPLAASVPIYMFHLAAWVDDQGLVHFRDDMNARAQAQDEKFNAASLD